jgi:HAD superfamily phosphatase (TIGR01668 family)
MSEWRSGTFHRESLSGIFRAFAPAHAVESLVAIDLDSLWALGKRLILLDIDNTIVEWKSEQFSQPVLDWVRKAKEIGFQFCIISNTRRTKRLGRICEILGVAFVRGRFKPSRAMFRLALIKFGRTREETVMIGDQMMTDILGANRSGIDAIWVRRMSSKEFAPTALNRAIESLLASAVYKALIIPEAEAARSLPEREAKEVTTVQQIIRFLVVGASSFVIDYGLTTLMMKFIHVNGEEFGIVFGRWLHDSVPFLFGGVTQPDKAAAPVLGCAASLVAMLNSFIWNRAWTFEAKGKDRRSAQVVRFYVVSIAGSFLNASLYGVFYSAFYSMGRRILLAKAVAAAIVAIWNFLGQRFFAFKARQS